jgi:1-aminocyclopropane-1-carboxylate deaminase/D-cysteine desulfhydrase-like pyridoxal-dependent ACC family enzyme
LTNSPVDLVSFRGYQYYIKRDDLLDHDLSGNKARKLYYYIKNNSNKTKIISYGGVQSNLMYSLSALANKLNIEYEYHSKELPSYLVETPVSNLKGALANGMNLIEVPHDKWDTHIDTLKNKKYDDNIIFVKQGGLQKEAELGLGILASEIDEYIDSNDIKDVAIFLPSGTGTTALYLQKHTKHTVYTTPCVGDSTYLVEQFGECEVDREYYPQIIENDKKYHFGKLYQKHYTLYKELLNSTKIEFDLLYDMVGWNALLHNRENLPKNIIYVHCGGIIGNSSMIDRYERKYNR